MPALNVRTLVVRASFTLALAGWSAAIMSWLSVGNAAGLHPGFVMALTIAATFSVTFAVTVVMPDKARMFSLGVVEGIRLANAARGDGPEPGAREPDRHLRAL